MTQNPVDPIQHTVCANTKTNPSFQTLFLFYVWLDCSQDETVILLIIFNFMNTDKSRSQLVAVLMSPIKENLLRYSRAHRAVKVLFLFLIWLKVSLYIAHRRSIWATLVWSAAARFHYNTFDTLFIQPGCRMATLILQIEWADWIQLWIERLLSVLKWKAAFFRYIYFQQ